jgi:hypothetical protein
MWAMHRGAWLQLDCVSDSLNFSEEIKLKALEAFGEQFSEFRIRYAERLGDTKLQPWRVGVENLVWLGLLRARAERQIKALTRPQPKRFAHSPESVVVDHAPTDDPSWQREPRHIQ